ncbi:MAG: aldehyde dehydrogenase [Nocardioides sp.]|nr:aldehyde dehydrogenase [Nocardioides sp.]
MTVADQTVQTDLTHHTLWIDGRAVDTAARRDLVDPGTGAVHATVADGDESHIDAAVDAAERAFVAGSWSRKTPSERAQVLRRIAAACNDRVEEFVEAEMRCNGATVRQATGFHSGYSFAHLTYFADLIDTYAWTRPGPLTSFPALGTTMVKKEPIGVVGAIAPWNFPLLLTMWKVAPALACGNSVVVKPDEHTPLSILLFAQIAEECGLPKGVLNIVPGDGRVAGARLASHPKVGKIAFTGSTPVGREIMRLASGTVKKVTLELGGKGPSIVLDDADLDVAVDGVLYGCFVYSGQVCESGTRAIVDESIYDEFVSRLVERAKSITVGLPDDWDTDMGPVINERQQQKILDYVVKAQEQGVTVALGGKRPEAEELQGGFYVEPTILTGVTNDMTVACDEIFGPVLSVLRSTGDADAVRIANDSEFGLAASVWSRDNDRALQVADQVQCGSVWINDAHQINVEMPFGGYKQSGVGRELGPDAFDEYTETKSIYLDLTNSRAARPYDILLSHADD